MSNSTLDYEARPAVDRPWMPVQLVAISFLFGPAACGVIAGLNFKRLGKPTYLMPSAVAGGAVFLVEAALIAFAHIPENGIRPLGMAINILTGLAFLLAQKPAFDQWKAAHWTPSAPNERYRPTQIGKLFLVALVCLIVEVAVLLGLMFLGGAFR